MLHQGSAVPENPWSGGLGDPLEPPWSPGLGAWLLPPAEVGAWELEKIIQPPRRAGSQPCVGACTARSQAGHTAEPGRGVRMLRAGPLQLCGDPAGVGGGPHEKPPPMASPKPPAAAGPRRLPVGWVPPCCGWRGWVHRGGMHGWDAWPWRRVPLGLAPRTVRCHAALQRLRSYHGILI